MHSLLSFVWQGNEQNILYTGELVLVGHALAPPSLEMLLCAFGLPLVQFGILVALILPMKFIGSHGGSNVWKFQLLGLGQAVTQ